MSADVRITVCGGDELRASVAALGFEATEGDDGIVAVVDASDPDAVALAARLPNARPRVVVASPAQRVLVSAVGVQESRVVTSASPTVLGPALVKLLPAIRRAPTRVVVVTGVRGGVGRTLLATNVARRLARRLRVCLIDATGSGAAAWWLRCEAAAWSTLEGLVDEMSADHLAVVAHDALAGLSLVGGGQVAPSVAILTATIRAATSSYELVIVDAPPVWEGACTALRALAHRLVVLSYDDAASRDALAAATPEEKDWVVASQSRARRIGTFDVFRALPRDEAAVAAAIGRRDATGGALGRAYDDLAELVAIDAS